jgi:hypothetical protein
MMENNTITGKSPGFEHAFDESVKKMMTASLMSEYDFCMRSKSKYPNALIYAAAISKEIKKRYPKAEFIGNRVVLNDKQEASQ